MLVANVKYAVKVCKPPCISPFHSRDSIQFVRCSISDLLSDDITKSAQCAQIVLNTEGFKAWRGWEQKCKKSIPELPPLKECWRAAVIAGWNFNLLLFRIYGIRSIVRRKLNRINKHFGSFKWIVCLLEGCLWCRALFSFQIQPLGKIFHYKQIVCVCLCLKYAHSAYWTHFLLI